MFNTYWLIIPCCFPDDSPGRGWFQIRRVEGSKLMKLFVCFLVLFDDNMIVVSLEDDKRSCGIVLSTVLATGVLCNKKRKELYYGGQRGQQLKVPYVSCLEQRDYVSCYSRCIWCCSCWLYVQILSLPLKFTKSSLLNIQSNLRLLIISQPY